MKIECTVEEFKELIKKETPVAGTTDVLIEIDKNKLSNLVCQNLANYGKAQGV